MSADRRARARVRNPDGFTVVEVLVVTLIIAVLLGIAMVTFLGAAHAAQDRAAQSTRTPSPRNREGALRRRRGLHGGDGHCPRAG